jgi:transposase
VRIALTSGLSRRQVADDLGVGFSTLNKWVSAHRGTDLVSAEDRDLARENERLRREVHILKEERDILEKVNRPGFVGGSHFQIGWSRYEQNNEQILP